MFEWLKGILGEAYTEEIDKKVSEEVGKAFVSKADFNNKTEELKTAKETIKERDTQLETLKKATGDTEALKTQIETLQGENKTKDDAHKKELNDLKLASAIEKALSDAKAKSPNAVRGELADFLAKAELSDDGTVKGLKDELEKLSKAETTSFLFGEQQTKIKGTSPDGTPTANPDPKRQGYETRLAEVRKTGDTVAAVAIKREAAAEGVILM